MGNIYCPSLVYLNEQFVKDKAIATDKGTILAIGTKKEIETRFPDFERINWDDNEIMIPGTVNAHNHSFQSLLRGIAVDKPFLEWRDNALYRYSPHFNAQEAYIGAVFAFSEMMKCGVTTVSDFFYLHNDGIESDEAIIQAAKDVGIRLVLARTMYDWGGAPCGYVESVSEAKKNVKHLALKYAGNDMTTIVPAPHSLHAASLEMVKAGHKLAQELNTYFHIHVAEEPFEVEQILKEYSLRPVELLDKLGVMDDNRMVAIHCVWLNNHEIELMGSKRAKLAYCPSSNMFLADGVTDIPLHLESGVVVGLGSDGACSNNRISVFEEMRMCAMLQKVNKLDALAINYKQAFDMGTVKGGEILQLPIGEIKEGYKADFLAIDRNDLSMQPISYSNEQILPNIVYSMQPTAIKKVIVDGKLTVSEGKLVNVTEDKIINGVQNLMNKVSLGLKEDSHY